MCVVKTPKVKQPEQKELPVLRNPYLDGVNPSIQSLMIGRSKLRIDPASPASGFGTGSASASNGIGSLSPLASLQLAPSTGLGIRSASSAARAASA